MKRTLEETNSQKAGNQGHKIGFQGDQACFSELAARKTFPSKYSNEFQGFSTFAKLFEALENGVITRAVVPLENSAAGTITRVYQLLLHYTETIKIEAETAQLESLCLCAPANTLKEDITALFSDSEHFEQSSRFVESIGDGIEQHLVWDSSAACAALQGRKGCAAIASSKAAEMYGLVILEQGVGNVKDLATRYAILGLRSKSPKKPNKRSSAQHQTMRCTLALSLVNQPQALFKVLSCFALRGLNLSKIESQPACSALKMFRNGARLFEVLFFVELVFEREDLDTLNSAIANVREFSEWVCDLGMYPAYKALDEITIQCIPWSVV